MTRPRLGPRTHNARAPARHSSHSDETTRLYNALQQFFQTSPNPRNIAVRRVLRLPQSFSIVAEFHDAQLFQHCPPRGKRRRLPRPVAAPPPEGMAASSNPSPPARREPAGCEGVAAQPLPCPRAERTQHVSACVRGSVLLRQSMEEKGSRASFPCPRKRTHSREPSESKLWRLSLVREEEDRH